MKKIIFLLTLFFLVLISVYSQSYNLEELNISEEYNGTYLPVDYMNLLKQYKSHEKAMNELRNTHYTVLMPSGDRIYSDLRYQDRYAVKLQNVKKWEFKTQNETQIIKDENGYEYKKISDKPFAYIAIANYILNALFSDYVSKDFRINENYLIINNENYKLYLNPSYTPKDISVFLQNKTPYFIRFSEEKLKLVKGKQNEDFCMQFDPTEEVVYECEPKR